MKCPNCQSKRDHRIIWGPRNISVEILNHVVLVFAVGLFGAGEPWEFFGLRRKCFKCGYHFLGRRPLKPNFDECPRCEYNLTGNTSGRCPECAWRLPWRFRAHRRKVDRKL